MLYKYLIKQINVTCISFKIETFIISGVNTEAVNLDKESVVESKNCKCHKFIFYFS